MKHPDPEKCRILADTFLLLYLGQPPKARVDMQETTFNVCGTVACHAGWFAVSASKSHSNYASYQEWYGFTDAANEMAHFLMETDKYVLEAWAAFNSALWGNENGRAMFCNPKAFGKKSKLTLLDISNHWRKVADRIEAANEKT